jgi:hypothetical protein
VTSRELTLVLWAVIGAGLLACLVLSAVAPRRLPTAATAIGALVSSPVGRVVIVVGWMWLGWHLFAR